MLTYDEDEVASKQELIDIHAEALTRFNKSESLLRDERLQCLQDRRFYSIAGAMWEGPLAQQFENKPRLEVNKIALSVIRIFNEYRNNRITVNFLPKDGGKNELTDVCSDLYRADELRSGAEEAYDNCFDEGTGGGFGAWRLRAEYEQSDDIEEDRQVINIEPIFDADSCVYFDPDAKRQDKADANYGFILSAITYDDFIEKYDDDPASWPKSVHQSEFDWTPQDFVYIAEYFVKEKAEVSYIIYKGLSGEIRKYQEDELDIQLKSELKQTGFKRERKRRIEKTRIHKYIMCGNCILSDEGYIAGENIPIVPFYGKRWFIDGIERCMGHVRLAKDAQRLKNMQVSKLAEISAYSTVEKPIFVPEQVKGHIDRWAGDNINNPPFQLVNPITDVTNGNKILTGPIAYTKVPTVPPAMAALLQLTEDDIKDILGNQEAGEQLDTPMSGVAIELVQNKLDMQVFIYIDNMKKAMQRSGEIWLSMAKDIYTEEGRRLRTINSTGDHSYVTMNQPNVDKNGIPGNMNDLTKANFDVTAKAGPTSSSKRAAIVRALGGLLQITKDPQSISILTALIMMNMEGEGIDDVRQYYRKLLLQLGVLQPTQEEAAELKQASDNQKPDANTQYLLAAADEAQTAALKNRADIVLSASKSELTKAQAMEVLKKIDRGHFEQVFKAIELLQNQALQSAQIQDMQQNTALNQQTAQASQQVDLPKQDIAGSVPEDMR